MPPPDPSPPTAARAAPGEAMRLIVAEAVAEGCPPLAVLERLHADLGHLPPAAAALVAAAAGRSVAEIRLLIAARPALRAPRPGQAATQGEHWLRLCRAEACRSMGADRLLGALRAGWGVTPDSPAGGLRIEIVHCLSLCAAAPSVSLDGRATARMTPARLEMLLRRAGLPPQHGQEPAGRVPGQESGEESGERSGQDR